MVTKTNLEKLSKQQLITAILSLQNFALERQRVNQSDSALCCQVVAQSMSDILDDIHLAIGPVFSNHVFDPKRP